MQTKLEIFGWPLFSFGISARGIIAVGVVAHGFIAIGQLSYGIIAIGQLSAGIISIAQVGLGVLSLNQLGVAVVIFAQVGLGIIASFGFGGAGFISNNFGYYKIPWKALSEESSSPWEAAALAWNTIMRDPLPLIFWSAAWFIALCIIFYPLCIRAAKRRAYFSKNR